MDDLKTFRDRIYAQYVDAEINDAALQAILTERKSVLNKIISAYFPKDKNAHIIELGCGMGALLHSSQLRGYTNVVGVDCSTAQLKLATRLDLSKLIQSDGTEYLQSLKDKSVDFIIAYDVLEHLNKSEAMRLLSEIYRVLTPAGKLLLHLPNAGSPFFGRIRYGDLTHCEAYTRGSLTHLLSIVGFGQVDCYEETPVVSGALSLFRWLAWKFVRTFWRFCLMAETGERNDIFSQNMFCVVQK